MNNAERSEKEQREIQEALSRGPAVPAPMNLYRRVTQGVRIAAWRRREEARFRHTLLGWAAGILLVLAASAGVVAVTNLDRLLRHGISGGLGWFDYYVSASLASLGQFIAQYTLALALALACGTLLLGLLPLGRSLRRG